MSDSLDHPALSATRDTDDGEGVPQDFLTSAYDITFAPEVRKRKPWRHRHRRDTYEDLCHLVESRGQQVFFVGSKSYVPLFCGLTDHLNTPRTVFFN